MKKLFKNKVIIVLDVLIIAFFGIYLGLNLKIKAMILAGKDLTSLL